MNAQQEEGVKKANERALKVVRLWRSGQSYRVLSKKLGISIGRVREIVRRGKELEVKA